MSIHIHGPSSRKGAPHEILLTRREDGRLEVCVRTMRSQNPEDNGFDAVVNVADLLVGIGRAMNGEEDQ